MYWERKLLCLTFSLLLFFFNSSLALAVNFSDVGANHWERIASSELQAYGHYENKDVKEEKEPQKLKAEEYKKIVEHLPGTPYTDGIREVEITDSKATILAHNILPVKFEDGFKSKKAKQGDVIYLVFDKNLDTEEGTTIIPAGSRLIAEITKLKKGKLFHINGEAEFVISNLVTPSGEIYPLTGKIENNEILDPEFSKKNLKRGGIVAGSAAVFGTLLGLFIGLGTDLGDGTALGAIIGGGVGAILGLATPGYSVNIPAHQEIYFKLNNNMIVNID